MVSDDIHQIGGTFQIVMPGVESLVDGEELLIMGIIVEFWRGQCPRVERDQMDLAILTTDGDDTGDGIVRGIGFHNNGMVRQPMSQDGGGGEGVFEALESNVTVVRERPRDSFPGKAGERNHNLGVLMDEATIEVRKTEEGLDVLVTNSILRVPTTVLYARSIVKYVVRTTVHRARRRQTFSPCSGYFRIPLRNLALFDSVCFPSLI